MLITHFLRDNNDIFARDNSLITTVSGRCFPQSRKIPAVCPQQSTPYPVQFNRPRFRLSMVLFSSRSWVSSFSIFLTEWIMVE